MSFQSRLKELRKHRKLTQEELGNVINVTKVSISGYENGNRTPDTETLQKLADFFEVSVDYLLGRTDNSQGSSQPSLLDDLPEDLRELFMDPELQIAFRDIPGTPEEVKEEIIELLSFIKKREKNRKPGDKQGE